MQKRISRLWLLAALMIGIMSSGISLSAQQSAAPPDQPPAAQAQPPDQPAQQAQPPASTPDPSAQPAPEARPTPDPQAQSSQDQVFRGTIVKAGDKWVLQDASGKSFDLDNQNLAKQYEGKSVRVQGVLDSDGKTIHMK